MKKAKVSKYGQWKYPGQDTIIPNANGSITMQGVPYPVLGIDDQGNQQMMMPGMDYQFPGNSVYEIPMAKKGGAKKVKIKSLPKAQVGFQESYDINISPQENLELNKRAKIAGWNSVDEYRKSNWAYNQEGLKVTNPKGVFSPGTPSFTEDEKTTFKNTIENVENWEKGWYSKRAQLPQFTGVALKRLNLIDEISTIPWTNDAWLKSHPGAAAVYKPKYNTVNIPQNSFDNESRLTHERSHWLDFNAPQGGDWQYNNNDKDDILKSILPKEFYDFNLSNNYWNVDPLRRPNFKNKQYSSETEKILDADNPWEPTDNFYDEQDIEAPFENSGAHKYYYRPTEVRARLNEWRKSHNIDPLKDYSIDEIKNLMQQDYDKNTQGQDDNYDLYKVIQGNPSLLKQLNDAYVSTGNKENPDEMPKAQTMGNVKKGKTLFGRPYQVVETEAGPDLWGNERPGETTQVKTVYYKNGNVAKQKIDNNEKGSDEVTWHDKDGKVTAEKTGTGYRTFSNGYFDYTNNVDYETTKRRNDEVEHVVPKNKLDGFLKRAKLNLENMSKDGSQPGDSYNTVWPDWENDRHNYTRTKNPAIKKSHGKFEYGGIPKAQAIGELDYFTTSKKLNDEKNRIAQMRNNVIPVSISHDATSDNKPFKVRLPEGQPYCTTRACEAEREAGFPIKQVASGYKLMNEATPENGWYPTSYDKLQPGDIAQIVRNGGFGHTMISTGNASNMPEQWRGDADPNQKGFYWDNGSGQDFQFASPKSEDQLAGWMNNVKKMNYYTYKGNLPQYEKEYSSAVNNYLHDTSEGDAGPIAPIDAIPHKKQGGSIRQVKIKSLPKAQAMGQFSDWRNILDYKNAAEPKQNLVGNVRKVEVEPVVAESTKPANTPKAPVEWKDKSGKQIIEDAKAQEAYEALPEELKRRDVLTADTRSDTEKFARRAWTAVSQPMETIAALNKGYDIPSGYLGMHNAYEGYDVGSPMTSVVDMAAGIPGFIGNAAYRQGEQIVNNPFEYALTNTLGLFDPKSRGQAISNYLDLSAVIPVAHAASPLLRNASRSTAGFTKPTLLTNITDANTVNYGDDIFQYLAETEAESGVDRSYLSAMPNADYQYHQGYRELLQNPDFQPSQDLLSRWIAEDARINNRVMPPPDEITLDANGFAQTYANPFATQNITQSTSTSLLDRLMGRLPGFRRSSTQGSIDLRRPENFVSTWDAPELPKNRSQFTKEQAKDFLKDKGELDKLDQLDDQDFRNILLTPDGKIKFAQDQQIGKSEMFAMDADEYVKDFNDNIDLLNNIIRRNNESGRDYMVTSLEKVNNEKGLLHFRTPEGRVSTMNVGITPGRFRGNVKDIADEYYMTNSVPGLQMEGASPIFGVAVPKTRTYQSLNEFLKTLDMGRIKSGMNIQSEFSRGLWEDAVKKGNAFGYYKSPRIVHGIMKKEGGTKKKKPGFQVLTDANGKYVFVKT